MDGMGIFHPRTGLGGGVGITNHAGVGNISCEMPREVYAVGKYRLDGARSKRSE